MCDVRPSSSWINFSGRAWSLGETGRGRAGEWRKAALGLGFGFAVPALGRR